MVEVTRSATDAPIRSARLLVAGLSVVVLTVAVLQTAVVPVLGVIATQLGAPIAGVSWAVTANLLAAVAATPLLGRLADLHAKYHLLLAVLAVVLAGSILAATTSSLALLIVARVLQAPSYALYPISIAILREELPQTRLMSAMAVLSGTLGFGGGAGLVVVGLLMSGDADYHRVFWLTTAFTVAVVAIVVLVVPRRPRSAHGTIDWWGAAGLATGLSALLLAITQGRDWGWTSPEHGAEIAEVARERAPEIAELARRRGAEIAEVARERGPEIAELARRRGAEIAEVARERAPEVAETVRKQAELTRRQARRQQRKLS
ncbi:major facilitator superfamily transporter [Mycolicibacterium phlei]|nr:major facilitator superfamily transporter [Mycolicibacterium phlei]